MNDLAIFEKQLQPLMPNFAQVLAGMMPVERMVRSLIISVERNPKLLDCDRQSLLNAGMTGAVLGLEADGVTGQFYLLPFKNKVQPCVGYKGYNTIGARGRITLGGEVVREGDLFEYELGTRSYIRHLPKLDNTGRITAAWASAVPADRPATCVVMGRAEIDAVMNRSPAVRFKAETPWTEPLIGFPAMASKTAKRRLARSLPLTVFQLAARMDEAFEEQGKHSWISPDRGVMIEGEAQPLTATEPSETPTLEQLLPQPAGGTSPPRCPPEPSPVAAAESASGQSPPEADEAAARLKDEISQLGTRRAHETWARNNGATLRAMPMRQQHEVVNFYENHKERATS